LPRHHHPLTVFPEEDSSKLFYSPLSSAFIYNSLLSHQLASPEPSPGQNQKSTVRPTSSSFSPSFDATRLASITPSLTTASTQSFFLSHPNRVGPLNDFPVDFFFSPLKRQGPVFLFFFPATGGRTVLLTLHPPPSPTKVVPITLSHVFSGTNRAVQNSNFISRSIHVPKSSSWCGSGSSFPHLSLVQVARGLWWCKLGLI